MGKQEQKFRPYAAPANVISVINRARTRNLPDTINNDFLRIAGVPEGSWYRVMQALQFLGLVYEDGRPSEMFEGLAGATDTQYKELLDKVVREAYRAEFNVVDPGQDPQPRIINAFQPYKPRSQIQRMVMLFQGLCREAGIPLLEAPRERRMREPQVRRPKSVTDRRSTETTTARELRRIREITGGRTMAELLFSVTEDDINALTEEEFNEVWTALGKVARARARTKKQPLIDEEKVIEEEEGKE